MGKKKKERKKNDKCMKFNAIYLKWSKKGSLERFPKPVHL